MPSQDHHGTTIMLILPSAGNVFRPKNTILAQPRLILAPIPAARKSGTVFATQLWSTSHKNNGKHVVVVVVVVFVVAAVVAVGVVVIVVVVVALVVLVLDIVVVVVRGRRCRRCRRCRPLMSLSSLSSWSSLSLLLLPFCMKKPMLSHKDGKMTMVGQPWLTLP